MHAVGRVTQSTAPTRALNLFDSTCIIVGIIVGAGIYETAPTIAKGLPHWTGVIGIWLLGGVLSLAGALCYAELATAYPEQGGDYVYLNRAYGRWAGYLFAWGRVAIIRPGSIASMAFPFARYLQTMWSPFENSALEPQTSVILAAAAVILLTAINCLHLQTSKWTQNVLTVVKILGIMAILLVALAAYPRAPATARTFEPLLRDFNLALILVLFTYGGWNEIAYVAAEVKDPEKNLVRSLVLGTLAVTVVYVSINGAFLHVLGLSTMVGSQAVATDAVKAVLPQFTGAFISVLICISTLGAINGLIFTGARISYALGREHEPFRQLANWSPRLGTPTVALAVQGCLSVLIVVLAGSFTRAVIYTTAVVWMFFLATGLSVFVLRVKEPARARPYRMASYPYTPIVFCASCIFLTYSALDYDLKGSLIAVGVLLTGVPLYWLWSAREPG